MGFKEKVLRTTAVTGLAAILAATGCEGNAPSQIPTQPVTAGTPALRQEQIVFYDQHVRFTAAAQIMLKALTIHGINIPKGSSVRLDGYFNMLNVDGSSGRIPSQTLTPGNKEVTMPIGKIIPEGATFVFGISLIGAAGENYQKGLAPFYVSKAPDISNAKGLISLETTSRLILERRYNPGLQVTELSYRPDIQSAGKGMHLDLSM